MTPGALKCVKQATENGNTRILPFSDEGPECLSHSAGRVFSDSRMNRAHMCARWTHCSGAHMLLNTHRSTARRAQLCLGIVAYDARG